MIGVRFLRATRPFGAGDTTLLPAAVAQAACDAGDAELYDMPGSPYSVAIGTPAPAAEPSAGEEGAPLFAARQPDISRPNVPVRNKDRRR